MGFDPLTRRPGSIRRLPPMAIDAGIGALFVLGWPPRSIRQPLAGGRTALLAGLTLVLAASLALRRRTPLAAIAIGTAALVVESFLHVATGLTPLATLVERVLGRPSTPPGPGLAGEC